MDKENKGWMKRLWGKIRKPGEAVEKEKVSIGMSNVSSMDISPATYQKLADIKNDMKNLEKILSQTEEELQQANNKAEQHLSLVKNILEQRLKELKEKESEIESIKSSSHEDLEKTFKKLYESYERVESNKINLVNKIEQFNKIIEEYKKESEAKKEELAAKKRKVEKELIELSSQYESEIYKIMKEVQETNNTIKKGTASLLAQKILLMIEKYGKEDFDKLSLQEKERVCLEIKEMYGYRKDHISSEEKILEEAAKIEGDEEKKKLYEKAAYVLRKINNAYSCVFEEKTDKNQETGK